MNTVIRDSQNELTPRQKEIFQLILEGHDSAEIANRLGISVETARGHTKSILRKNGVHSQLELLAMHLGRKE